jgi:hypothetical protein
MISPLVATGGALASSPSYTLTTTLGMYFIAVRPAIP